MRSHRSTHTTAASGADRQQHAVVHHQQLFAAILQSNCRKDVPYTKQHQDTTDNDGRAEYAARATVIESATGDLLTDIAAVKDRHKDYFDRSYHDPNHTAEAFLNIGGIDLYTHYYNAQHSQT